MPAVPSPASNEATYAVGGARPFSLRFFRDGHQIVVEVGGDLVGSSTPMLIDPMLDVIEAQGNRSIAFDLSGVILIDPRGLEALVSVHRLLEAQGGTLVVRGLSSSVRALLEATGMDRVLTLASLQASRGGAAPQG